MRKTGTLEIWECPTVSMYHDDSDENLITEIELPGVKKNDLTIESGEEGFCIKAKKENVRYDSCYHFSHRVIPEKTRAEFINGLLKLRAPLRREALRARKIAVQ